MHFYSTFHPNNNSKCVHGSVHSVLKYRRVNLISQYFQTKEQIIFLKAQTISMQ